MRRVIVIICCWIGGYAIGQTVRIEDILADIYNQLAEAGEAPMEDLQETLTDIAAHPIDLNHTSAEELQRLYFLDDEQIDAILLYQYKHPFQSIYELQLIPELHDYDIRNLLPFVQVGSADEEKKLYIREVFHYAKHELTLRADARNCENLAPDPFYAKLRYRFNYNNRVQAGVTFCRPTSAPWKEMQYGGFVQLCDIGHFKSIVAGDYQASFGQGLVVGSPFHFGKSSYLRSTTTQPEGLRKYTSVSGDYQAFHGIGTTARIHWADISAFYSVRRQRDSTWHHAAGVNVTGRWKQLKVGVTALENLYSDTAQAPQVVVGLNARYNTGRVDVWGEVATTQGVHWGVGTIVGARFVPVSGVNLLAIYRYYSEYYNNQYAYSLSEHSRLNDEMGGYVGAEIDRLRKWRFAVYADGFRGGYDGWMQADFLPCAVYGMNWRVRARRQSGRDTYAFRYQFTYELPQWRFRTQLDANMVKSETYKGKADAIDAARGIGHGFSVFQDVEYHLQRVPIVLQVRAQAFDARLWYNRIYVYENDVLYAYSFPNAYGAGGRLYVNARYRVNDVVAMYLRVSETIYSRRWAAAHDKKGTRTDVHALVRVRL